MKVNKLFENDHATHMKLNDAAHKYPLILNEIPQTYAFITDIPKNINNAQLNQLVNMSFNEDTLLYFEDLQMRIVSDQHNISHLIWMFQRHNIPIDKAITTWKQFCNHVNSRIPTNDFED